MKHFLHRLPALLLIIAMLLTMATGCGKKEEGDSPFEESDVSDVETGSKDDQNEDEDEKTPSDQDEDEDKQQTENTPSDPDEEKEENKSPSDKEEKPADKEEQKDENNKKPGTQPQSPNNNSNTDNKQENNDQKDEEASKPNDGEQKPDEDEETGTPGDADGDGIEDGSVEDALNKQPEEEIYSIPKPTGYEDYLTVVSFNIKCAMYGQTWDQVVNQLKEIDGDLVGLQECDFNTKRSGSGNQVKKLAEEAGYKYWYFAKTIDHQGGEYGHGILSKYPIKKSDVTFFKNQKGEIRNVERHEITVKGKTLTFYNTHLNGTVEQYYEIQKQMDRDEYAILTGDLNFEPIKLEGWLKADRYLPLNGGPTLKNKVITTSSTAIDNIIVTKNTIDYWFDEKQQTGITVHKSDASDHNMIYGYIKLK